MLTTLHLVLPSRASHGRAFHLGAMLALATALGACGGAPSPVDGSPKSASLQQPRRSSSAPDDCAEVPGEPPPEPLLRRYDGVAKKARCQREVYTIMGGVTHFLGVECKHCHLEPNYAEMTHRKQIANWMARELIPRLEKRGGGDVWCRDCHQGRAKILANPRKPGFAIEWMTTHLVEDFDSVRGEPLRCRNCHQGDLGSPEFQRKIILTDNLPARATEPSAAPAVAPDPALPPVPPDSVEAPSRPLPDYGGR